MKMFILLALDGQQQLVSRLQASLEEFSELAWSVLETDQRVEEVRVIENGADTVEKTVPESDDVFMVVTRGVDRRTGRVCPSWS